MTNTPEVKNLIIKTTANACMTMAAKNSIEVKTEELKNKMIDSMGEWIPKIIDEAREDAKQADLFNQLPKKITPLVSAAFSVAITHGCVNYAKFLLNL